MWFHPINKRHRFCTIIKKGKKTIMSLLLLQPLSASVIRFSRELAGAATMDYLERQGNKILYILAIFRRLQRQLQAPPQLRP